jgi:hypothetical protein
MAQIKPVGSSSYVAVSDYLVAVALMDPANDYKQNNTLLINKVPYQFDTLILGSGGSWASANLDTILTYYGSVSGGVTVGAAFWDFLNDIEEGTIFDSVAIAGKKVTIKALFDRQGFTGEIPITITDSNGLFNDPFDDEFTIPADSSTAVANLTTTSSVTPGTYTVVVRATVDSVAKTRTFVFVVSATSSSTPGEGWEDIDL